jgi:DNA topoisomerase-2
MRYTTSGVVVEHAEPSGACVFEITELPAGRWPEEYKAFLAGLVANNHVRKVLDQGSDETIRLRVHCSPEQARSVRRSGALKFFKLTSTLSMGNMHLFDGHGLMRKYSSAEEILDEFAAVRLEYYRRRREHLMLLLEADLRRAANKIRFIDAVTRDELVVYKQKKTTLLETLHKKRFHTALQLLPRLPIYKDHTVAPPIRYTNSVAVADDAPVDSDAYDYLLNLPLSSLTAERLAALQSEHDTAEKQLRALSKATPEQLWLDDLDRLEGVWNDLERKRLRGVASAGKSDAKNIEDELEEEEVQEAEEVTL